MEMIDTLPPGAQGEDEGVGNANDFMYQPNKEFIPPESKPVQDEENRRQKKDTSTVAPKIGDVNPGDTQKKKKGFLRKLFGKKEQE